MSDLGVRFDAPGDWTEVDPALTLMDQDYIEDTAEAFGTTPAQFETLLRGVDLILFGRAGDGSVDNLNVLSGTGPLPDRITEAQLESQLAPLDGRLSLMTRGSSDVGDYLNLRFSQLSGGRRLHCAQLTLQTTATRVVVLTVTSPDAARADEVLELVARTLERT